MRQQPVDLRLGVLNPVFGHSSVRSRSRSAVER
jgi:hypothetical protein